MRLALMGADSEAARWSSFGDRLRHRLGPVMTRLGLALQGRVEDNLDGAVLRQRSGRLAAAQSLEVRSGEGAIDVSVGFDPAAMPYGAIHEFGGTTRAHLIEAKNARALALNLRGQLAFAKRVQHPGSLMPQRSFLRSALAGMASETGAVEDAVNAEIEA